MFFVATHPSTRAKVLSGSGSIGRPAPVQLARVKPAGYRIAKAPVKGYLAYRMQRRHPEDVQRIETGGIAFRDIPARIDELQNSAPIGAPAGRHVQHIGGEPLVPAGPVVMHGEKIAGPVECRLRI